VSRREFILVLFGVEILINFMLRDVWHIHCMATCVTRLR
jgi:hypothetical protein